MNIKRTESQDNVSIDTIINVMYEIGIDFLLNNHF